MAMTAYLLTLYPGVGGGGDAAKFQYLGRVLGTAHTPGYPLYIFVSWVFSHLPIGTLAYRINFMSAFFAACAVACVVLVLRRLGCGRVVALCAALGLAFDRYLWGKAVGAEVYTLGAFLVGLMAVLAVRWAEGARTRDLYALVLAFGVSLGNHLTAAMVAPAIAILVLVVRPAAIRVKTVAICALLVLAGLSQYLFILVRTWQKAPFVEASATNLRELYGVLRATPYADEIFAFSWTQLWHERLPLMSRMFADEMGNPGLLALAAGVVTLLVRRQRSGVFFAAGAAGVVFLALNVDADVDGFLASALPLVWIIAGVGLDGIVSLFGRIGPAALRVATAVIVVLPVAQLAAHYKTNDHHRRTAEIRYLNALFARLEDRAAIVREAYSVDQLILYKLAGEQAAGPRTIELIPQEPAALQRYVSDGFAVYAFSGARSALESRGFGFEPITLYEPEANGQPGARLEMADLPLFRVSRHAACLPVANLGWRDITAIPTDARLMLRIDNYRPFDSVAVMYVGGRAADPLPGLVMSQGPMAPDVTTQTFRQSVAADAAALADRVKRDGAPSIEQLRQAPVVHRIEVRVNDDGQFSLSALALSDRPAIALIRATADLQNPLRATVCGWSGRDLLQGKAVDQVPVGADGDAMFGQGWQPAEQDAGGAFRRSSRDEAEMVLPLAQTGPLRLSVHARLAGEAREGALLVGLLNGHEFSFRPMTPEWTTMAVDIAADWLRPSMNRLVFRAVPLRGRPPGPAFAVKELSVTRLER
jgi:hypothetical protein